MKVARTKLDKRLKCDAESDASHSDPAATLKSIFSANKILTDCSCAVLFIRNTSRDTLLKFSDIHNNITPHVITQQY